MADHFKYPTLQTAAAPIAFAVTPNDGADIAQVASRGLCFNAAAAATLTITDANGSPNILFTFAVAGFYILPVQARRVWSTGTTVTNIVALCGT